MDKSSYVKTNADCKGGFGVRATLFRVWRNEALFMRPRVRLQVSERGGVARIFTGPHHPVCAK
jgi:hypothetical protein